MNREEIANLVTGLADLLAVLAEADPQDKADVYRQLGLRLTCDRAKHEVLAETRPAPPMCLKHVSEDQHEPKPNGVRRSMGP